MRVSANHATVRREQSFAVYVLGNSETEIAVVPELGARIISLKNRRTGREWMWHPGDRLKLFRNCPGDNFSDGPLAGMDECLPTIEPCVWRGRRLHDHGEVWTAAWEVDEEAWKSGAIKTSVSMSITPFEFARTLELDKNEIRLIYHLFNRSQMPEYYIWAMHPLLKLQTGDRLVLPSSTRASMNGEGWMDALDLAVPNGNSFKIYGGPLKSGFAAVQNGQTGERIEFEWVPAENNGLGLWLTRGGWHGHHHFAIEPTNAGADALTAAVARQWCGMIEGESGIEWRIRIRIC